MISTWLAYYYHYDSSTLTVTHPVQHNNSNPLCEKTDKEWEVKQPRRVY